MISSVNAIKSTVICGFGHIYYRNPEWKTSFFEQCIIGQIRYSNPRTYLLSNNLCSESSQKELFDAQFKCFS